MNPAVSIGRLLVQKGCVRTINRGMASPAPWNYLWKPGPYPEDQDARKAAAKKYGMLLEDYKPYEDRDVMSGDYPCLPIEPTAERNGLYEWDDPTYKRNYGEPLQEEWIYYHDTKICPNTSRRYSLNQMYACMAGITIFWFTFWHLSNGEFGIPRFNLAVSRQQLLTDKDRETHYTFDVPE